MVVERVSGGSSVIDVLDRVLDKGIVIDAWARISLVGIDLMTVDARAVVAASDHPLNCRGGAGLKGLVFRPQAGSGTLPEIETEITRTVARVHPRRVVARRA
ncbi:MAG: gas vesicle protein [Acidobacteria bacterium]|nr:gas vesicle protein [Acidobacteriota bacterium]